MTSSPAAAASASGRCAVVPQSTVTTTRTPSSRRRSKADDVRAVALAQAIRHVDPRSAPDSGEEPRQQRRRGRAVDVVVAEDGDRLAVAHGANEPLHRGVHIAQMGRVRQLIAQARGEKTRRMIVVDPALGEQPADDFGQSQALGDDLPSAHRRRADASAGRNRPLYPRNAPAPPAPPSIPSLTQTLHVLIVTLASAGVQVAPRKCLLLWIPASRE